MGRDILSQVFVGPRHNKGSAACGLHLLTHGSQPLCYHIHHNVRHGNRVNRDCTVCHPDTDKELPAFELAPYVPANMKPVLVQESAEIILDGKWQVTDDGALQFVPNNGVATSLQMIESTIRSEP